MTIELEEYLKDLGVDMTEITEPNFFILTKEECDTLWRELMHYHIPYENPQMRDVIYKIRQFLERNE